MITMEQALAERLQPVELLGSCDAVSICPWGTTQDMITLCVIRVEPIEPGTCKITLFDEDGTQLFSETFLFGESPRCCSGKCPLLPPAERDFRVDEPEG